VSLGGGPGSGSEAGAGGTLGGLTRSRSWLCCPADRNNRSASATTENNHDAKPQVSSYVVWGLPYSLVEYICDGASLFDKLGQGERDECYL
jgi:hypothetical protein